MKKISLFLILISVILISCGDKDKIADEIVKYYNEEWIPINNFKKDNLGDLTTEFITLDAQKDKSEATEFIDTKIIPMTEEVISKLEDVDADNKNIEKMNNLQLEAEEFAIKRFQ